jgi:predicted XRE-type DNA-binding protein
MNRRRHAESTGNVFADLKLPRADDLLVKAELAAKILEQIERRRLTQSQATALLGVDHPKISALKQGRLAGFSIERLPRFPMLLGRDVEIRVKEKPESRLAARLRVA